MTNSSNDQELIAAAVTAERLALSDVLEELSADEWRTRSLCDRWTVHEVVAHLTLATRETMRGMIGGMIKARGRWERMNAEQAIARASRCAPAALVGHLRDTATSTRRAPMSNPVDPLIDILVHTQDIVRPLGRHYPMHPDRVKPALTYAVGSRWYGAKQRFEGLRLAAADSAWTFGTGDADVVGDAGDLLLVAVGRPAALEALTGPGAEILTRRLGPR